MTFRELYDVFDSRFPTYLRCEWDNDGIMCCGDADKQIKKILVALDVTSDTVQYAIKNGFDTVISHHPLVFHAQNALCCDNFTQKKLIDLVKGGVSVMSFHTRLDSADNGVNDTLCSLLKFKKIEKDEKDSIGRIGILENSMSISSFAENVKEILGSPCVFYVGNREVKKVYVVGGDGKDYIERAKESGADTLLTGKASYNSMLDAYDMGLNVIEAGHFYTENPICRTLVKMINEIDSSIYTECYNSNKITCIK